MNTTRSLALLAIATATTALHAQIDVPMLQRSSAAGTSGGDTFGRAVDLDGDRLAVGAPGNGSGVVTLYERSGSAWQLATELSPGGLDGDAEFGLAVALDGDRLVVGAPTHRLGTPWERGVAFVYERDASGVWQQTALLDGGPGGDHQAFGSSVAIDGDRIVVGAPAAEWSSFGGCGMVQVFELAAGSWTRTDTLGPSDAWINFEFGASVALAGDRFAVGAPSRQPIGASVQQGGVYVFSRSGGAWSQQQILIDTLPSSAGAPLTRLGRTLAFDGQTIVAGSAGPSYLTYDTQGALVFELSGSTWAPVQKLTSSASGFCGSDVAVEGGTIVLGASDSAAATHVLEGAATVWVSQSTGWSERWRLREPQPQQGARFGAAVALSNGRIAVGIPGASAGLDPNGGAVAWFDEPASFGDVLCFGDGSGTACPCGTNSDATHGPGCPHSHWRGALLVAGGSPSVASDDLTLTAVQLVPGKTAVLAFRANAANGGAGVQLHSGLLCIAGPGGRLGTRTATEYPWTATWGPGLGSQLGAASGATLHFQVWFRDPTGGCGATSNFSNAFRVQLTP